MVGPGTGLAPFRGFLHERRHILSLPINKGVPKVKIKISELFWKPKPPFLQILYISRNFFFTIFYRSLFFFPQNFFPTNFFPTNFFFQGDSILFFGSRNPDHDYMYKDELEGFVKDGTLSDLQLAFSRVGKEKVYVQHKMKEGAMPKKIWEILSSGGYFYVCGYVPPSPSFPPSPPPPPLPFLPLLSLLPLLPVLPLLSLPSLPSPFSFLLSLSLFPQRCPTHGSRRSRCVGRDRLFRRRDEPRGGQRLFGQDDH
jgi:hypothetical protein